jgi:hypothetical protein
MFTAVIFLDIERPLKLMAPWLDLQVIKIKFFDQNNLVHFFFCNENSVSVEGEMSTPRCMQAGVPQGSILSPLYITCGLMIPPKL